MRGDFTARADPVDGGRSDRRPGPDHRRSAELPLLTSKLIFPAPPSRLVQRTRLYQLLDDGVRGPVTVLTAPAGWGKTVLLSDWARATPSAAVAWLSIERGDDEHTFWSYLRAALATTGPAADLDLPEPGATADQAFLTRFAGALTGASEPIVLIVDDFHQLVDREVLRGLEFLLRHTAPALRLVIGTRVDPTLHRWLVSGELTHLGTEELAFTADEATELMAQHGLKLPAAQFNRLLAQTEGWPAGLRFAALSTHGRRDTSPPVDEVSGDDHGVADYLTSEVLAGQSAQIQDVLLSTSILERMSGDLVDALTGRTDGAQVLAELERTNAFIIPLATRPPTYRYHRMFGELLRAELHRRSPELISELHHRATAWYAAEGRPRDALRHALAAQDWTRATTLLDDHWHELALGGHSDAPRTLFPPPPPQEISDNAELALAFAADRMDLRKHGTTDDFLRLADRHQHLLAEERRDRFALMNLAFHLSEAQRGGDVGQVTDAAARMLALTTHAPNQPMDQPSFDGARAIALTAMAAAQVSAGDFDASAATLRDALTAAGQAGLSCLWQACTSRLAFLQAIRGELRAADRTAWAALDGASCPDQSRRNHCAYAYLALSLVCLQRGKFGEVDEHLDLAASCADPQDGVALAATIALIRAQLMHWLGDVNGGLQVLQAGRSALSERKTPHYLTIWFAAVEADLRISQGDTDRARKELTLLLDDDRRTPAELAVAYARSYLRDDDPGAAARALPLWTDDEAVPLSLSLRLEAGLLAALTARRVGDRRKVTQTIEHVLRLAEPEGFQRPFLRPGGALREMLVEHLDSGTAYWSLLSELTATSLVGANGRQPAPAALAEALTERELTVLRYLQSILSTGEIACELSVSVNTVKTHVRNIYRKLEATRRRDAVQRARSLQLL